MRIKDARTALGLSQEQLAQALGLSGRMQVWRWEQDPSAPAYRKISRQNQALLRRLLEAKGLNPADYGL